MILEKTRGRKRTTEWQRSNKNNCVRIFRRNEDSKRVQAFIPKDGIDRTCLEQCFSDITVHQGIVIKCEF